SLGTLLAKAAGQQKKANLRRKEGLPDRLGTVAEPKLRWWHTRRSRTRRFIGVTEPGEGFIPSSPALNIKAIVSACQLRIPAICEGLGTLGGHNRPCRLTRAACRPASSTYTQLRRYDFVKRYTNPVDFPGAGQRIAPRAAPSLSTVPPGAGVRTWP